MDSEESKGAGLRARLDQALRAALKARDPAATAALRSGLAAIANAEAVSADGQAARVAGSEHFAGAAGLGAAEVPRRVLTGRAIEDLVRAEIAERQQAAGQYARAGHADRAARLQAEIAVLRSALED